MTVSTRYIDSEKTPESKTENDDENSTSTRHREAEVSPNVWVPIIHSFDEIDPSSFKTATAAADLPTEQVKSEIEKHESQLNENDDKSPTLVTAIADDNAKIENGCDLSEKISSEEAPITQKRKTDELEETNDTESTQDKIETVENGAEKKTPSKKRKTSSQVPVAGEVRLTRSASKRKAAAAAK